MDYAYFMIIPILFLLSPQQLQDEQEAKAGNVSVIDKSAESKEIQEALAKNPDISRERNNLMQGTAYNMRVSHGILTWCMLSVLSVHF